MAFDDLGKGLAAVCNPMTVDKTTNPGAPMIDIAAELERLVAIAKDGPHKFSRQQSTGDVTACLRGNIDTIIAALRAAGEVEELRKVAAKILAKLDHPTASVTQWDADELRRALAGSATPANQRDANNDR